MFVNENKTPFLAEAFATSDKTGAKRLVVLVKATFFLDQATGRCEPAPEQVPFIYTDTPYGDFETTSIRLESDFAPKKPNAEVLLDAVAMAPGGQPVDEIEVALVGPGLRKHAIVSGQRRWIESGLGFRMSSPRLFTEMPLAWHLTYGGTDRSFDDPKDIRADPRNPVGSGFHRNSNAQSIEAVELPCIEHPSDRMRAWDHDVEPIGFGPVPRMAAQRAKYAGTYDQAWMDTVLPFLPTDFDDRYHQSAPQDQWLDALLPGQTFLCAHMNETGRFEFQLPELPVHVTFDFGERLVVQSPRPDTLIISPHRNEIVLLARTGVALPRQFTKLTHANVDLGTPVPAAAV